MPFTTRRALIAQAVLATAAVLTASPAAAQAYPNKPIRMIVPTTAGGGNDFITRTVAKKLEEMLGWTIVVENKPGASGIIATEFVAKSAPDGNTLYGCPSSVMTLHPGDVIFSGTPPTGLGPVVPGDTMFIEMDGLGSMTVAVHGGPGRKTPSLTATSRRTASSGIGCLSKAAASAAGTLQVVGRVWGYVVHGHDADATDVDTHFHGRRATQQIDLPLLESVLVLLQECA